MRATLMARGDNRFGQSDWLRFDREGVDTVLLGATKPLQLADNLGATEISLTDDELAQLDAATACPPHYPSSNWVESMLPGRKRK